MTQAYACAVSQGPVSMETASPKRQTKPRQAQHNSPRPKSELVRGRKISKMVGTELERILAVDPSNLTDEEFEELWPTLARLDLNEIGDAHDLRNLARLGQLMLQYKDNQVESLLMECGQLKETISSLKPEAAKRRRKDRDKPEAKRESGFLKTDAPETDNYDDALRGKSKKIKALMTELESLEKENQTVKEKLTSLLKEMEDATEKMNEMTEELSSARLELLEQKERISQLEKENSGLAGQIEEMNSVQLDRDRAIDEFGAAIDVRISEWKEILDGKNEEINRLRESLSQSLMQSVTTVKEQSRSEIVYLNEEIDRREKLIGELQNKLTEATAELNESASVIETLKTEAHRAARTERRKEQRDLSRKLEDSDRRVIDLENQLRKVEEELAEKSSQLCDVLSTLKKYEERDEGLTEALNQVKELKLELEEKNDHVKDLVNVINKLEMLNSYQEMEIVTLREKLGMPEDESISIEKTLARRKEEARRLEELAEQNRVLVEENLELKSDMRVLRFKLDKSSRDRPESLEPQVERTCSRSEMKRNMRMIIEENEALRTGMHEILDSIRNQDGKSEVEIQSSTLERLLEALDVRHLAGWYHPAMRMQEHLNVVQGSNAELRGQLKQLRKELEKKNAVLEGLALRRNVDVEKLCTEEPENGLVTNVSELKELREAYQNEGEEWKEERDALSKQNTDLKEELDKLKHELEAYQGTLQAIQDGEDEVKKSLLLKTKEFVEAKNEVLAANKKIALLQELLNNESSKLYQCQKEFARSETGLKKSLIDSSMQNKLSEREVSNLQTNLANSVSKIVYDELREKYESLSISFHGLLENKTILEMSKGEDSNLKELMAARMELQEELANLHGKLSNEIRSKTEENLVERNRLEESHENCEALKIENENLRVLLKVTEEESERQYLLNSLKTMELDSLRHQILDLQAASEDKATISRLDFELANKTVAEMELNSRRTRLENEVTRLEGELENSRKKIDSLRSYTQDCRRLCENRCRTYLEVISFLQSEYAGSTSLSSLKKISSFSEKLKTEQRIVEEEMKKARECHESGKALQETLNNRLQIVESLKDILEQQIGSNNVQEFIQRFSEYSQYTLNEFKHKRRIGQLEHELELSNKKWLEYESLIRSMEQEMIEVQRAWIIGRVKPETRTVQLEPMPIEARSMAVQAIEDTVSRTAQTDPYTCCLSKKDLVEVEVQVAVDSPIKMAAPVREKEEEVKEKGAEEETTVEDKDKDKNKDKDKDKDKDKEEAIKNNEIVLRDQLTEALKLASERSAALLKYESRIAEYQAKVDTLSRSIETKDLQLARKETELEQFKVQPLAETWPSDGTDKLALKSTVNSLQKLLGQKEETIVRYQTLLKEDRDEHSRAAARLQEEIKGLQIRILTVQSEAKRKCEAEVVEVALEKPEPRRNAMQEEETARSSEKISTLEADLKITRELSERWHRLAEERLHHMDRMRERLEEQHKNELESYRAEMNKWQTEAGMLRKQLAENRMLLTKGNISLMKELQERDDKIHELSLTCQQLQNEIELMESARAQHVAAQNHMAVQPIREQLHPGHVAVQPIREQPGHVDPVRRQLQSLMEKERIYKHEIADLKQQLSRRYMAVKAQEKKTSQREIQLERKVRMLEEELERAKAQLDREYLALEAKKAKTAEELSLWEKQKKWQQTAERLKEKLKEKTEEHSKLLASHEKLRSVVACMEREKWYLKSKLKVEGSTIAGGLSARPAQTGQQNLEELQRECQQLRNRVKQLTDQLESEDNAKLLLKIEEQRRRIAALEAVSQGSGCVIGQLEKLEMTKDILEKMNLKLESENFELRLELERITGDAPRLREKVEHLERYVELLKEERSSDSTPRSDKDSQEPGPRKSGIEMEKTIFTLKRIIEKLQADNKRLRADARKLHDHHQNHRRPLHSQQGQSPCTEATIQKQYEEAQARVVILETDLQLAEQKVTALEKAQVEDESVEVRILRQQLLHKSELLDKVKLLLSKAATNERTLRQRIQQLESKQPLSTIPECHVTPATPE